VALTWTRREPAGRRAETPLRLPVGDDGLEGLLTLVALGDEQVEASLEREHVRRSLDALTDLQREAVVLAVRAEALATGQVPPATGRAGGRGRARQRRAAPALRFRPLLVAAAVLLVAVLSVTAVNLGVPGRTDRSPGTSRSP
jgi:DNA-directed RNA polymerase specialized sigma24 family protein